MANSTSNELYKIRVIEEKGEKVKVHYVGYSEKYDEWKRRGDLVILENDPEAEDGDNDNDDACTETHVPSFLYQVLGNRIKQSLNNGQKASPCV